jgi:hypothetical protein
MGGVPGTGVLGNGALGIGADGNDGPPGNETGGGLPVGSVYGLDAGGCCPGVWANT